MFELKILYSGMINADECFHFYGQTPGKLIDSPSWFYYLTDGKRKILVDTGMDGKEFTESCFPHTVTMGMPIEPLLRCAGTAPEEITDIIFTHLHWDHIGGLGHFINARMYCRPEEIEWAFSPEMLDDGYRRFFEKCLWPWKDRIIPTEKSPIEGITLLRTGGHSVGSQCVIADTKLGRTALPGDVIARYRNVEENIPAGSVVNIDEAIQSIPAIMAAADVILPSHDWLVAERHPVIGMPEKAGNI